VLDMQQPNPTTPARDNGRPIEGVPERVAQDMANEPIIRAYLRRAASADGSILALLSFGMTCVAIGAALSALVGGLV
jgi:hypothetical protein